MSWAVPRMSSFVIVLLASTGLAGCSLRTAVPKAGKTVDELRVRKKFKTDFGCDDIERLHWGIDCVSSVHIRGCGQEERYHLLKDGWVKKSESPVNPAVCVAVIDSFEWGAWSFWATPVDGVYPHVVAIHGARYCKTKPTRTHRERYEGKQVTLIRPEGSGPSSRSVGPVTWIVEVDGQDFGEILEREGHCSPTPR